MADEKKTFDPNEDIKVGEDLSIDELLTRLRDEHGVDFGQKASEEKKPKKPESESEKEIDEYNFDNRPFQADYINYNIVGRGMVEKPSDATADIPPEEVASLNEDDVT